MATKGLVELEPLTKVLHFGLVSALEKGPVPCAHRFDALFVPAGQSDEES
jgi:hypothetical protein